jgi:hypothetical protein
VFAGADALVERGGFGGRARAQLLAEQPGQILVMLQCPTALPRATWQRVNSR